MAKKTRQKTLTIEEINAKKDELKQTIQQSIEKKKKGRPSKHEVFLLEIKDVIKDAIDNKVSYRQISSDIESVYKVKVGDQTIRQFAHKHLGVEKRKWNSKNAENTTKEN